MSPQIRRTPDPLAGRREAIPSPLAGHKRPPPTPARSPTQPLGGSSRTPRGRLLCLALFIAILAPAERVAAEEGASGFKAVGTADGVPGAELVGAAAGDTIQTDRSELRVSAEARVEVAPDRVRISFAVETEAETAREAGEANAVLMDRVLAAVRETGVEGLRTETSGYALAPRYQPSRADQPRVIVGYTARNHLQVIADDVEAIGRILDTALQAGANRIAGLQFEIRDPDPHRREALRRAVAGARSEAEAIAEALGVRLGSPLEVQAGSAPPVFRMDMGYARAEMAMEAMPTTPVEAGLQTVSANVSIRYRIHPES